jgi:excisionase family DNA binding protein
LGTNTSDRYLTIGEAADYLNVAPLTIKKMLRDGRLPGYKLGPRVVRIRLSDIESALQPYNGDAK